LQTFSRLERRLRSRLPAPIAVAIAIAIAIVTRPRIIIASRISVSLAMNVPKGAMVGPVFATTIKSVLVGALVRVRQLVVEPIVGVVTVVVIIVSKRGYHGYNQH